MNDNSTKHPETLLEALLGVKKAIINAFNVPLLEQQEELKPCPFCGGKASLFCVGQPDGRPTWEAECENSECEVSSCTMLYGSKEEAVRVWNKRY